MTGSQSPRAMVLQPRPCSHAITAKAKLPTFFSQGLRSSGVAAIVVPYDPGIHGSTWPVAFARAFEHERL